MCTMIINAPEANRTGITSAAFPQSSWLIFGAWTVYSFSSPLMLSIHNAIEPDYV